MLEFLPVEEKVANNWYNRGRSNTSGSPLRIEYFSKCHIKSLERFVRTANANRQPGQGRARAIFAYEAVSGNFRLKETAKRLQGFIVKHSICHMNSTTIAE